MLSATALTASKSPLEAAGKPGLDYIYSHALQLPRNTHLFLLGHGCTRTLLTIA